MNYMRVLPKEMHIGDRFALGERLLTVRTIESVSAQGVVTLTAMTLMGDWTRVQMCSPMTRVEVTRVSL